MYPAPGSPTVIAPTPPPLLRLDVAVAWPVGGAIVTDERRPAPMLSSVAEAVARVLPVPPGVAIVTVGVEV